YRQCGRGYHTIPVRGSRGAAVASPRGEIAVSAAIARPRCPSAGCFHGRPQGRPAVLMSCRSGEAQRVWALARTAGGRTRVPPPEAPPSEVQTLDPLGD